MRLVPLVGLLCLSLPALAQQQPMPGTCALGTAEALLDVNDVRASAFNTGSLFYGNATTNGDGYAVPKALNNSSIFTSGLWVGGRVNGELRVAGALYEDFTFWPGPLGTDGRPVAPNDCSPYDRIYSVSRADIAATAAGNPVADVVEWPADLGAPVLDGDGNPDNYDFAAGDRPDITGDQALFWVMNDSGGPHTALGTPPLGIEVRVLAFAFDRSDALGQTTFYRYTLVNRSPNAIEDAYISVFADPDLGSFDDDFVGSDPARGMAYVYNGRPTDDQYGIPPALGYDLFQGPIVPDGSDAGTDPDTLGATAISYFQNVAGGTVGGPRTGVQYYNVMQGLWGDGSPMRARGDGFSQPDSAPITTFMFPGDPVTNQVWSEVNPGPGPVANTAAERRFAIHTGPFELERNTPQEIVFGIVFAQGTSNLNSVTALRAADALAQLAFDSGFDLPPVANEVDPVRASALVAAPNPFAAETRITVPPSESVRAVLFDVLGRQVAVVHDGPLAGDLRVSGAGLTPGVYLLRVQGATETQTVRLVRR